MLEVLVAEHWDVGNIEYRSTGVTPTSFVKVRLRVGN